MKKDFISYQVGIKHIPEEVIDLYGLGLYFTTHFEEFLKAYQPIFLEMVELAVKQALTKNGTNLKKESEFISEISKKLDIQNRCVKAAFTYGFGLYDNAKENRNNHINVLQSQYDELKKNISELEAKVAKHKKTIAKKYKEITKLNKKNKPVWKLESEIIELRQKTKNLKFQIHNKKRNFYVLAMKIKHLSDTNIKPLEVTIPSNTYFYMLGEVGKPGNNPHCRKIGSKLEISVPKPLVKQFGNKVSVEVGDFKRNTNRMPDNAALTWFIYQNKSGRFVASCQFKPNKIEPEQDFKSGGIGIDLNPGSVDLGLTDSKGNYLKGLTFELLQGLRSGKMEARIVEICLGIAQIAEAENKKVFLEDLSSISGLKSKSIRRGKKLNRMLSQWGYQLFVKKLFEVLNNRGIPVKLVNPAYTSEEGCLLYMKRFGISSGIAAGIAIARRGLYMSAKPTKAVNQYLHQQELLKVQKDITKENSIKDDKERLEAKDKRKKKKYHVWSRWSKVKTTRTKQLTRCRHLLYLITGFVDGKFILKTS